MKILFIAQYGPLAASSRTRVFDYLPLLRKAGVTCDVRVVTPDDLIKRSTRGILSRLLYYILSYSPRLVDGMDLRFYSLAIRRHTDTKSVIFLSHTAPVAPVQAQNIFRF